jgi:hypothetical protein
MLLVILEPTCEFDRDQYLQNRKRQMARATVESPGTKAFLNEFWCVLHQGNLLTDFEG